MGKKAPAPPAPDLVGAAKETAAGNAALVNQQTIANRPNQNTAWGSTSWTQDPASGQWTETQTLNPAEQSQLDSQRAITGGLMDTATGLLGRAQQSSAQPLDFSGMPQMTGYDQSQLGQFGSMDLSQLGAYGQMDPSKLGAFGSYNTNALQQVDPNMMMGGNGEMGTTNWGGLNKLDPGFGAVEGVRDAMMSRMAPQLEQQKAAELQRLQNQGLGANTEAYQRALTRIEEKYNDANQQALLGGMSAYGDIFNRGLAANQQEIGRQFGMSDRMDAQNQQRFGQKQSLQQMLMALRGQQFGEQDTMAGRADSQRGQQFGEQGYMANLADSQRAQQFGEQGVLANLANQNRAQEFNEQGAMGQLSGQQRQQAIAEQQMLRNDPYNQLMMLQGQSPTNPTMPSFMGAGVAAGPDILGATQGQYTNAVNQVNAKNAGQSSMLGGLMGLGGSVLGGPAGGFMGGLLGKAIK